jgi:hypothetical protein
LLASLLAGWALGRGELQVPAVIGCALLFFAALAWAGIDRTVAALVALVVMAGAARIPSAGGIQVTSYLLLACAAIGLASRFLLKADWPSSRPQPTEILLGGMLVVGLIGLAFIGENRSIADHGLVSMGQHFVMFLAVSCLPATRKNVKRVLCAILAGLSVQVLIALAELLRQRTFLYSEWKNPLAQTWHGLIRLASTPADPNYLALGLVAGLPLLLALPVVLNRRFGLVSRTFVVGAWVLVISLTFSRAGYLGLFLAFALLLLISDWRARVTYAVAALGSLVVAVLVAPSLVGAMAQRLASLATPDASTVYRTAGQRAALMAFEAHPLFGIGYNVFVSAAPKYVLAVSGIAVSELNALNSYLLVAAEGGFVALVLFVSAILSAVLLLRPPGWITPERPLVALAKSLSIAIIVFAAISVTVDGIHSSLQWFLLGLAVLLRRVYLTSAGGVESL